MESLEKNIDRLKDRFNFTKDEISILNSIKKYEVESIALTTEGGFKKETGEFDATGLGGGLYKICIKYFEPHTSQMKVVCLIPEKLADKDFNSEC
ncbi:hypothetical protein E0K83_10000 [Gramella sp. BOM4]|nr:hypothetical protein [Christiangramia bathymodioli]